MCATEIVAKGQMMTKCPSKRPNLWDRGVRKGSNDDQMSFKETNFVKQNWSQWVKWWPNVLQRDQLCETELVAMGQMMTKSPSKRPNLWDRSVRIGSNAEQISLKETKFMKQKCSRSVKCIGSCPIALLVRRQLGGSTVPYWYLNANKSSFWRWISNEIEINSNTSMEIINRDSAN